MQLLKSASVELATRALEARDPATSMHCVRVAELAARLAEELAESRHAVGVIQTSGSLHDLGVIGIRDTILNKPGTLNEDEWEVMRRHPDIGSDLIAAHPGLSECTPNVRHHHERWDGSGYPTGLKGEVIPLGARILAVAESFDTITHPRPYRRGSLTISDALRDMGERSGTWYDPAVVDALSSLYS